MKIAVTGNLGHLNYLFEDLPKLPQCQVVAAASAGGSPPERTIRALAELKLPQPELFGDHQTMLDKVRPDIVVIGGPFEERALMCQYAIERNIAVFTEKPAAITLEELDELEAAVKKHNGVLYGMMGIRFEPPFYTALEIINSGMIGKVKLIYTRKSYKIGNRPEYYFCRSTYGGTIPWVGIHAVDWIACCNAGKFRKVRALQHYGEKSHGTLETAAHCIFELDSGAIASADIDFMRPSGAPTHGDDRLRAVGEKGIVEAAQGKVEMMTDDCTSYPELKTPPVGCFGEMVRALASDPAAAQAETALTLQVTRAALTAQKSADLNQEIKLLS